MHGAINNGANQSQWDLAAATATGQQSCPLRAARLKAERGQPIWPPADYDLSHSRLLGRPVRARKSRPNPKACQQSPFSRREFNFKPDMFAMERRQPRKCRQQRRASASDNEPISMGAPLHSTGSAWPQVAPPPPAKPSCNGSPPLHTDAAAHFNWPAASFEPNFASRLWPKAAPLRHKTEFKLHPIGGLRRP